MNTEYIFLMFKKYSCEYRNETNSVTHLNLEFLKNVTKVVGLSSEVVYA